MTTRSTATSSSLPARVVELAAEREQQLGTPDFVDAAHQLGTDEPRRWPRSPRYRAGHRRWSGRSTLRSRSIPAARACTSPCRRAASTARTSPRSGFSLFWLSFVAFWTWGAAHGSWLFACFSIPFWLVGLSMSARALKDARGVEELALEGDRGVLLTRVGPFVQRRALETRHLTLRRIAASTTGSGRGERTTPAHLALGHGTKTFQLLAGRSEAELDWVEDELRRWLGRP